MSTAAQVALATRWEAEDYPNFENWKDKMDEYIIMAKVTSYLKKDQLRNLRANGKLFMLVVDKGISGNTLLWDMSCFCNVLIK